QLPVKQRASGYAMQSFFIGIGSVIASLLPWLLAKFGVDNTAGPGEVPATVHYAFYFGGAVLLGAILWTVFTTREYPPERLHAWDEAPKLTPRARDTGRMRRNAILWLVVGIAFIAAVATQGWAKELYILGGLVTAYGVLQFVRALIGDGDDGFRQIMDDLQDMPQTMRQLAVVQFFSWFALFAMWIYTTGAVTSVHYGSTDTTSAAYNEGANWVGVLFAAYNGFAALAAIVIPFMVKRFGLRVSHLINATLGGLGLISIAVFKDPQWLLLSMVGVGFAWASILSLPYALLSDSVPAQKMGVYMGIFNFFIVIPQLVAVSTLPVLMRWFGNHPLYMLVIGGVSMIIAGACVLRVREPAMHAPAAVTP
ncbi:MAG: MFS transporter, partial [Lysobacter sp.]|nr:MFS transporter [Lysobacter sp.]